MHKKIIALCLATLIPVSHAQAMSSSDKNQIVKAFNDALVWFGCIRLGATNEAWEVLKTDRQTQPATEETLAALSKPPFEFIQIIPAQKAEGLLFHEVKELEEGDKSNRYAKTRHWQLTETGKAHVNAKCTGFFITKPIILNPSLTPISTINNVRTAWLQADVTFGDTPVGLALSRIYQNSVPQRYVYKFEHKDNKWQYAGRVKY